MKNFKIIFYTAVLDKNGKRIPSGSFERVIVAKNRDWAVKIANAMVDEELGDSEHIDKVILLEETGEEPSVDSQDNKRCWARVLNRLYLKEKQIQWIVNKHDSLEIVGFLPK